MRWPRGQQKSDFIKNFFFIKIANSTSYETFANLVAYFWKVLINATRKYQQKTSFNKKNFIIKECLVQQLTDNNE